MLQDAPIEKKVDDKLNRGRFVDAVVDEIKTIDASSSFTVGMYGEWGTGKTSLIELFREQLEEAGYFTTYFNPWRFKNEESLIRELFLKILQGVNSDKQNEKLIKKLGKKLDLYSKSIYYPPAPLASLAVSNAVGILGKFLGRGDTLETLKKEINEVLSQLANPLIIFIDDIDRLDNSEIQQLFKILKLTADFNKLIYVLAFDDEMVAKSLSQVYGNSHSDGLRFIEKIVQLPLRIPRTRKKDQYQFTLDLLNDWIERKKLGIHFEQDKLRGFLKYYQLLHELVVKTPRDSKRLINSISFVESCLRDEINVLDVIFIETIRIFLPRVFNLIIDEGAILFSRPSTSDIGYMERRYTDEQANKFIKKIQDCGLSGKICKSVINFLFPINDLYSRNYLRGPDEFKIHFQNQRIGVHDYFYRYLGFKIDNEIVPDKIFKRFFEKLNMEPSYENLKEILDDLLKFSANDILRRIMLNKNNLTNYGKKNVVKLLATEKHFLSGSGMDEDLFQHNIRFPMQVLKDFDRGEDLNDALSYIMKNNENIYYVADFIQHAKRTLESHEGDANFQKEVNKIEKEFIEKILSTDVAQFFENAQDGKNTIVFHYFEENGKLPYLKEEILKYLEQDRDHVFTFLKTLLNPTYAGLTGKKIYTDIRDDVFSRIEKYIDRENLVASLNKVNEFYQDRKLNQSRDLSKATEHEQIAIQYFQYLWRQEDNPENHTE